MVLDNKNFDMIQNKFNEQIKGFELILKSLSNIDNKLEILMIDIENK